MTTRASQPTRHRSLPRSGPSYATPRRSPARLRVAVAGWLSAGLAALLLAAGCTTGDTPTAGSTATAAQLTRAEIYEQIAVGGPPGKPLFWEIEWPTDPRAAAAVRTAQYFESLVETLFESRLRAEASEYPLLRELATGQELEIIEDVLRRPRNPRAVELLGPRWIRLLDVEAGASEAVVVMCIDKGYWRSSGIDGPPRRTGSGSDIHSYRLVADLAGDDPPQWKVAAMTTNSVRSLELGVRFSLEDVGVYKQRCAEWATHTPADILRYARPTPAAR